MESKVVVTGIGVICCLGNNKKEVISTILEGKTGIASLEIISTNEFATSIGGEADFPSNEFEDRSVTLARQALNEAIDDANIFKVDLKKASLVFGTCNGGIRSIESFNSFNEIPEAVAKRYIFNAASEILAEEIGVNGSVQTVNTACAASGISIGIGYDMIKQNRADIVIAGGSDAMSKAVYAGFNSLQSLSEEPCSPYDESNGLSLGEGAAFVILENREHAEQRNAHIYTEIAGYGLSNDAYHPTAPEPEGGGVTKAVQMALSRAGVSIEDIEYVNTHGTGTSSNDGAELRGIKKVFGSAMDNLKLSSSKSYFGHNLGAAAAIELATTLLIMENGYFPATINHKKTRNDCKDYNLIFNQLEKFDHYPKSFLINNSAFGGYNCSLVCSNPKNESKKIVNVKPSSKVYVTDYSFLVGNILKNKNGNFVRQEGRSFSLKEYRKDLYQRRMNSLTQYGISALASLDEYTSPLNNRNTEVGIIFGTRFGSLESAGKYLNNVWNKGFDKASSIYFPDMVLNSTGGKLHSTFDSTGYAFSLSTGGNELSVCILNAYSILSENKIESVIAAAGEERSEFEKSLLVSFGNETIDNPPFFECVQLSNSKRGCDNALVVEGIYQNFDRDINSVMHELSKVNPEKTLLINISKNEKRRNEINEALIKQNFVVRSRTTNIFEDISNEDYAHAVILDSTENGNNVIINIKKEKDDSNE